MKEEQITADYQRKRRIVEEDEDILKNTQRKREQLIQETLSDIYRMVQQSAAVASLLIGQNSQLCK